jgi:hypothetical protein
MPLRAPGGWHALIGRHQACLSLCRPLHFDLSAPHADAGGAAAGRSATGYRRTSGQSGGRCSDHLRDASKRVVDAFRGYFGADRVRETGAAPASEDFGSFGSEWHVPSVFWFVGGTDPEIYAKAKEANRINELPVNHSPKFAPVLNPTLRTGIETLVVATRAWLSA